MKRPANTETVGAGLPANIRGRARSYIKIDAV